jgi:hypothetical protein
MNIKIFCRCSLFPSWSGKGLISTPVKVWKISRHMVAGCELETCDLGYELDGSYCELTYNLGFTEGREMLERAEQIFSFRGLNCYLP